MNDCSKHIIISLMLMGGILPAVQAQDLTSFEKRVTVRTLANGLTVLVCERPEAPVFSFFAHVNVGSDREVPGITGLAHMLEHMAFKGTEKIGTTNYAEEKNALENIERAYQAFDQERRLKPSGVPKTLSILESAWKDALATAEKYVVPNQFGEIIEQNGGRGLNASTSHEETVYHYSLPSNRVELWAYLESERFLHPVLREFYKERDVVQEERRLNESQPLGRLFQQFLATAYIAHPYGHPVIGWPSDLESLSMFDARDFYAKYYVPANIVIALVGDVKASEVLPIVERYFGRLPARPKPLPLRTTEPMQKAERIVILRESSQPIFMEGYHKPSARDNGEAAFEVLRALVSDGRTSRLYRSLVRDKKIAASSGGFNGFPGNKYPNLFGFYAVSTPGHTASELRDAIRIEIENVKNTDIARSELDAVKSRAKANLVRSLGTNQELAFQLATAQALYGDWRRVFRQVDEIEEVTSAQIRQLANTTFLASNRTVGMIESTQLAPTASQGKDTR